MCARGLLGESEVITWMLLGQRRRAWAVCNRVFCAEPGPKAGTPRTLLLASSALKTLEDKDEGKTQ